MSDRALNQVSSLKNRIGKGAAALAVIATLVPALPPVAHSDGRWDPGAAAIVGVIGGLALGSALSGSGGGHGSVGYSYGHEPRRYEGRHSHYREYAPSVSYYWGEPQPTCYIVNERVWVRGWGWDVRPMRYCE